MADNIYQLAGKVNVPAEKKDEMNKYVLEILDKCGIRKTEKMTVAGTEVIVVSPVQPNADGIVMFDYSIFEKKKREICTYDLNTCELYAEDSGYCEFGVVMNMIMVLQEVYTNGGCYFVEYGKLCTAKPYLHLLQGVLGKRITLPGRIRMWDTYLFFRNSKEYSNITFDELRDDYSVSYGELDVDQLIAVFEVENQKLSFSDNETISCREEIDSASLSGRTEYAYRIFCSMNEDKKITIKSFLAELLNLDFSERKELLAHQDEKGIIAELSLYLLPAYLILAYAKAVGKDFWEIWDSFGSKRYSDIIQEDYPGDTDLDFRKIPFYKVVRRKNEDEFLEFWDGRNLILSQDMKECIQRWKEQFSDISVPSDMLTEYFLAKNITRLNDIYFRYVDKSFVTEFIEHGNDLNHKKALILLERLLDKGQEYFPELTGKQADEWIIQGKRSKFDCVAISALLSLLTNNRQRNKIFGF